MSAGEKKKVYGKKSQTIMLHKRIKVSIVIPNNGRDISKVIQSIKDSTYKHVEIIIIDEGKERSEQRNIGIKKAIGKYIMILDSDQILTKHLLQECVSKIRITNSDALYIPEQIPKFDWFARIRNFERQFYNGTAVDCVRFVKAKECPLFDEELNGPEDTDWDMRITGKKAITYNHFIHDDKVTFKEYIKKKRYYSKSMDKFAEKNPHSKILNIKYRCFTVFTENDKWKKLLRHPRKTFLLICLLALRGYLWKKK